MRQSPWVAISARCLALGALVFGSPGSSSGSEEAVDMCVVWRAWDSAQKEKFLEEFGSRLSAKTGPILNWSDTDAARFDGCFAREMSAFLPKMDEACAPPGASMNSGEMDTLVIELAEPCIESVLTANLCSIWGLSPAQKEEFLDKILGSAEARAVSVMPEAGMTDQQIAAFRSCWAQKRPVFSRSMDEECMRPGASIDDEQVTALTVELSSVCIDKAFED